MLIDFFKWSLNRLPYGFMFAVLCLAIYGCVIGADRAFGQGQGGYCPPGAYIGTPYQPYYLPVEIWGAPIPYDPVRQAKATNNANVYEDDWDTACEKWSKKNGGKTWFETSDWENTGKYLVERGADGHWRYTRLAPTKDGPQRVKDPDAKPGIIKDLSKKAGIEETSDAPKAVPREQKGGDVLYGATVPDGKSWQETGVVPSRITPDNFVLNGHQATRHCIEETLRKTAAKIDDISAKPWLIPVGTEDQQRKALAKVTPAMAQELNIKGYTLEEVKEKGLKFEGAKEAVSVYVTDPEGLVMHHQYGEKDLDKVLAAKTKDHPEGLLGRRYNPNNDPDLRIEVDHNTNLFSNVTQDKVLLYGGIAAVLLYLIYARSRAATPVPVPVVVQPSAPAVSPTKG